MSNYQGSCSRRDFLLAAIAGTGSLLLDGAAAGRERTAAMSNLVADAGSEDIALLSVQEVSKLVRGKKVSPVEITRACLARIAIVDQQLNAFVTVTAESALAEARQAETEIQRGQWRGTLHGIPIALKDLIDAAGVRTTAASALFKDRVPSEDAPVVQKLRQAGAVFLGKLNMHELAFGPTTRRTSYFGRVRNPWHTDHISGGSSGGCGAAVAAGLCYAALGSDTGGSIRQPAAFCGIVGLMPTYGRVSTRGTIPVSWSADHIGPMARSVGDAAIILEAIAGYDPKEPTSYDAPVQDYATEATRTYRLQTRVGVPREVFYSELEPEVKQAAEQALAMLAYLGAEVRDVEMEVSEDRTVILAEAYTYHAQNIAKHPDLYLPETLAKFQLGAEIDMSTYITARLKLDQHRRRSAKLFDAVDVLATPTTPIPAPEDREIPTKFEKIMAKDSLMWRNTRPFNLSALPTISVPCGFTKAGLPIGLQLSAAPWREITLLRLAHAYEEATGWHTRHPKTSARENS